MNNENQLTRRDLMSVPLPDIETSNETNAAAERPGRPRGKICRFLGKVTEGVIKKISATHVQDAPPRAETGSDHQSALREANEAARSMNLLSGPVTSAVSTAQNAPTDLEDACNLGDTYLRPLKIFDSVIRELADVHPYAKVVLGLLSSASKFLLKQIETKGYSGFWRS
ncbi:uncharacterized protein EDB93DRAFT_1105438 [Suillus bovinus]|uniref:uncharacterized protein n=1 Tax=Suillus bovinus TaxID=48563 RepID=UPI001B866D0F|nr:uncharacterized protein EDB93DRAFT_1105438 [Suillus bovinus]KAG2142769.1 hypothetical protein EDB93DRAFT_1105438 [Suillus bovinus]